MNRRLLLFTVLLISFLYPGQINAAQEETIVRGPAKVGSITESEKGFKPVNIDVFISPFPSKCKQLGNMFVVLNKKFGSKIRTNIHYMIGYDDKKDKFSAINGDLELREIKRQIAIIVNYPSKFWDYLEVRNLNILDSDWACYAELAGFSKDEIERIGKDAESQKIHALLRKIYDENKLTPDLVMPTLYINGKKYESKMNIVHITSYINSLLPENQKIKGAREWVKLGYGKYLNRPHKSGVLDIFIMSHCPPGIKIVNQILEKFERKKLSHVHEINFHYIVSVSTKNPTDFSDFQAHFGIKDVMEDARQLIIQKYFPDKFFKYLLIRNNDINSDTYRRLALRKARIDEKFVKEKMNEEGVHILLEDMQFAEELNIRASPTFLCENVYLVGPGGLRNIPEFSDIKPVGTCE